MVRLGCHGRVAKADIVSPAVAMAIRHLRLERHESSLWSRVFTCRGIGVALETVVWDVLPRHPSHGLSLTNAKGVRQGGQE